MSENGQEKLSLEEKIKVIQDTAEELNRLLNEEYQKIKLILDKNSTSADDEFTLTVGIQNAYLG
ncbi:MAG: hypothetical protein WCC06_04735 [Candidatus Aminicenantales bacterium]